MTRTLMTQVELSRLKQKIARARMALVALAMALSFLAAQGTTVFSGVVWGVGLAGLYWLGQVLAEVRDAV